MKVRKWYREWWSMADRANKNGKFCPIYNAIIWFRKLVCDNVGNMSSIPSVFSLILETLLCASVSLQTPFWIQDCLLSLLVFFTVMYSWNPKGVWHGAKDTESLNFNGLLVTWTTLWIKLSTAHSKLFFVWTQRRRVSKRELFSLGGWSEAPEKTV